jgi:2-polyprenyl-3-methyl-5-hydroxy-6-metoxy-1,4-benzoquinol methylase
MATKIRNTDQDWKRVAEQEPYWGVLSREDYRQAGMDAKRLGEFMASGEQYIAHLFALIRKHLNPEFAPARGLDFGCGVGRLLIPMAKRVRSAVGVDIAPAMLDLCRKHAAEAGVSNVELFAGDDVLSGLQGKFDVVNTYIVLQHIPPARGYRLIQALTDRLSIGGVASLQMTFAKARKFFVNETPGALYYRRDGNVIVDLVENEWAAPEGTITMFDYDLNEVMARVSQVCGHPVIVLPTNNEGHLGLHCVFQKARER